MICNIKNVLVLFTIWIYYLKLIESILLKINFVHRLIFIVRTTERRDNLDSFISLSYKIILLVRLTRHVWANLKNLLKGTGRIMAECLSISGYTG